jgi:hypothetical protein
MRAIRAGKVVSRPQVPEFGEFDPVPVVGVAIRLHVSRASTHLATVSSKARSSGVMAA